MSFYESKQSFKLKWDKFYVLDLTDADKAEIIREVLAALGIPTPTPADNGKVLGVVDGKWALVDYVAPEQPDDPTPPDEPKKLATPVIRLVVEDEPIVPDTPASGTTAVLGVAVLGKAVLGSKGSAGKAKLNAPVIRLVTEEVTPKLAAPKIVLETVPDEPVEPEVTKLAQPTIKLVEESENPIEPTKLDAPVIELVGEEEPEPVKLDTPAVFMACNPPTNVYIAEGENGYDYVYWDAEEDAGTCAVNIVGIEQAVSSGGSFGRADRGSADLTRVARLMNYPVGTYEVWVKLSPWEYDGGVSVGDGYGYSDPVVLTWTYEG